LVGEFFPLLCFTIEIESNNLTYHRNRYSPEQLRLHDLIQSLHDDGMGYRKISYYLNDRGIKTVRGKEFSPSLVYSVLKRKKELDHRTDEVREKEFPIKVSRFELKYLPITQFSRF
jgi:DNA-binding transcriptional MerR regulator